MVCPWLITKGYSCSRPTSRFSSFPQSICMSAPFSRRILSSTIDYARVGRTILIFSIHLLLFRSNVGSKMKKPTYIEVISLFQVLANDPSIEEATIDRDIRNRYLNESITYTGHKFCLSTHRTTKGRHWYHLYTLNRTVNPVSLLVIPDADGWKLSYYNSVTDRWYKPRRPTEKLREIFRNFGFDLDYILMQIRERPDYPFDHVWESDPDGEDSTLSNIAAAARRLRQALDELALEES